MDPIAPRPQPTVDHITDWKPETGHVRGANYEWDYAMRQPAGLPKPSWLDGPLYDPAPLATTTGTNRPTPTRSFPGVVSPESMLQGPPGSDFWVDGAGAVAMGAVMGEQRGGAIEGPGGIPVATTPLTLANAPTYFMGAPLSLLDQLTGRQDYTQNEDGSIGGKSDGMPIIGPFVDGISSVGHGIGNVVDGVISTNNRLQAVSRINAYADLLVSGRADVSVLTMIGDTLGVPRGDMEALKREAEKRGVDWTDMARVAMDIPEAAAQMIEEDPGKYQGNFDDLPFNLDMGVGALATAPGSAAWELAAGMPLSLDPFSDMAANLGNMALLTAATMTTAGAIGAIGRATVSGAEFSQGGVVANALATAGRMGQLTAKGLAINGAAGLGIRTTEWAVKQYAVMAGDKALADLMDRWLWDMPFADNVGLNFVLSFSMDPIGVAKGLAHGRLRVGRPGTAGEVGEVSLGNLGVVATGTNRVLTVNGRRITVRPSTLEEVGIFGSRTIDDIQLAHLDEIGWRPEQVRAGLEAAGLVARDLDDFVGHVYATATRDEPGSGAVLVQGVTEADRGANFIQQYLPRMLEMMKSDLAGETHFFRDTVKSRFWETQLGREDSRMAGVKAPLGPYDGEIAWGSALSWMRTSKTLRKAERTRDELYANQPRNRTDLNIPAIEDWRAKARVKYAPTDRVPLRDLNKLKMTGGFTERRGYGRELIARVNRGRADLTFADVERILDSVQEAWKRELDGKASVLLTPEEMQVAMATARKAAEEAAARPAAPGVVQPPPDPVPAEAAAARVTGVSRESVHLLYQVKKMDDAGKAATPVPPDLLDWYATAARPLQGDGSSLRSVKPELVWPDLLKAWRDRMASVARRSNVSNQMDFLETLVRSAESERQLAPELAAATREAILDIRYEMENPLGLREMYHHEPLAGMVRDPANAEAQAAWSAAHPGIGEATERAMVQLDDLAKRVDDLRQQVGNEHLVTRGELEFGLPNDLGEKGLIRLEGLIERAANDPGAAAHRLLLANAEISPIAKAKATLDVLSESGLSGDDAAFLHKWSGGTVESRNTADSALRRFRDTRNELAGETGRIARALRQAQEGGYSAEFAGRSAAYTSLLTHDRVPNGGALTPADRAGIGAGDRTTVGKFEAEYTGKVTDGIAEVRLLGGPDDGLLVDVLPDFISPEVDALYGRFVDVPGAVPATVTDVLHVLSDIDAGFDAVPGGKSLSPEEVGFLQGGLNTWMDEWLARNAGKETTPRVRRDPEVMPTAAQFDAEFRDAVHELPRLMVEDDTLPFDGWEGTQYDFGPVPDDPALPPRLILEDFVGKMRETIPGIDREILMRRKQSWEGRVDSAMLRAALEDRLPFLRPLARLADTAVGSRPELTIFHEMVTRLVDDIVGPSHPDWTPDDWFAAEAKARGFIGHLDDWMSKQTTGLGRLDTLKYRGRGRVPGTDIQRLADEYFGTEGFYVDFLARSGGSHMEPVAQALLKADNRVRNYFAGIDGGLAKMLNGTIEGAYASRAGRRASGAGRSLSVFYNSWRFLYDIRFLALNTVESLLLTLGKEGWEPIANAHGWFRDKTGHMRRGTFRNGKPQFKGEPIVETKPYAFKAEDLTMMRERWPWFLQQAEQGLNTRRWAYIESNVFNLQQNRMPAVIKQAMKDDPAMAQMLRRVGDTPEEMLDKLGRGYDLASGPLKNQKVLTPEEAAKHYKPLLDRGSMTQGEYDAAVKAGRWTPSPEIQAAIDVASDPVTRSLMQRLEVMNDQFWRDVTELHFGQANRSNLQRMLNNPLLYWPISYMVKATKWLGNIMFRRAFGHDTGIAGAWTMAEIHQRHVEMLASDPEYVQWFEDHKVELMVAGYFMPIWYEGIGVALSPFTKLVADIGRSVWSGGEELPDSSTNVLNLGMARTITTWLPDIARELAERFRPGTLESNIMDPLSMGLGKMFVQQPRQ